MDPVSLMIGAMVIAAFIVERLPEAAAEAEYARRGEVSPAYAARLKRLADAGIDPAVGGPMRQYLANAWRDTWLDLDAKRQAARAARTGTGQTATGKGGTPGSGWRRLRNRLADRVDQTVADRANRWRTRPTQQDPARHGPTGTPPVGAARRATTGGPTGPDLDDPVIDPVIDQDGGPDLDSDPDLDGGAWRPDGCVLTVVHPDDEYEPGDPGDPNGAGGWNPPSPRRPEPIRVESTIGEPIVDNPADHDQLELQGADMSNSLAPNGTAVTGVVSGAAEARAIARQLEAANAEYVAQLTRLRHRIAALGEQTAAIVQLSLRSTTVGLIVQAAEAAAAAQAAAKNCSGEVVPLMTHVAHSFDRLNS